MLESIKHLLLFKSVDKDIKNNCFDSALEKLNYLIHENYSPKEAYLKRGQLCKKLLMNEDAYSDFTYIITHCTDKKEAYYERMLLNFEIANYYEAVTDADRCLLYNSDTPECKRIKFLSYLYSKQYDMAESYVVSIFEFNKFKAIQFLFTETAKCIAEDELSKGLSILSIIEMIDSNNPIKMLKEANIYGLAGEIEKEAEIIKEIQSTFPKYFISHFRYTDMYEERNIWEVCFLLELKIFDKQGAFAYPMSILEGYKYHMEGHIIDSKEAFEKAIGINPERPEAYVLLAQTLQLMSGYDNPAYGREAEEMYNTALKIYEKQNLITKANDMRRQIKHLNSTLNFK